MKRTSPRWVVFALLGCTRRDPWEACRDLGPIGHRAEAPACAAPACGACVAAMEQASSEHASPAQRAALRMRFNAIATGARETYLARVRPSGSYPYDHCTASLAEGASCARYSPLCVEVLADGLRSGETSLAERTQYNLAAGRACPASRRELVAALAPPCAGLEESCGGPLCVRCVSGRLAAMAVLAPRAEEEGGAAELQRAVDDTHEIVARALVEALGGPDAPADLDTVVVQRALRLYCFSIVARSAAAPPYACTTLLNRFLTHAEFGDSPKAWAALQGANERVRAAVLDALLAEVARGERLDADVRRGILTLPHEGTLDALARCMRASYASDAMYAALREVMVSAGVTESALPPVNRPSTPATPDARGEPVRRGGALAPLRTPSNTSARQG